MFPSCRCASDNLHVPVEQTALLYKEGPESLRQPWPQQPADVRSSFALDLAAATRNLPAAECGVWQ